ncbi:MAG: replication-relaxation family protein [Desulfobacterales bacterium]|nr:replication-relaxation family protein [Desulfobacterales bacterium]
MAGLINTLFEYRFFRTDHLTALIDGDRMSLEKRLRKLWEHRFLERSFLPLYPEPATRPAIYSLDYRGANLLVKEKGIEPGLMGHVLKHNKSSTAYVELQLLFSNFRAVLALVLRNKGWAKIKFWRQDNEIRDRVEVKLPNGKTKHWPIAPDGFFCIEGEHGKMYRFIEADRYTMDNRRFLNKMRAYYHWWEGGKHTEKFGIKNFRVLTITHNKLARDRRLEVTKEVKMAKIGGEGRADRDENILVYSRR